MVFEETVKIWSIITEILNRRHKYRSEEVSARAVHGATRTLSSTAETLEDTAGRLHRVQNNNRA